MGDANHCGHFIPLARGELVALLCADPTLPVGERDVYAALCERIAATFHFEYNRRFQGLKADYSTFDPDTDNTALLRLPAAERQARRNRLYRDLAWLLERAHFRHLGRKEIEPALDGASDWVIRMDVDFGAFEHCAIFARGDTFQKRTRRRLRNFFRAEEVEVPVYRRLVLMLKLRDHRRLRPPVDTENVFLKLFKDIPKLDVMMLLPGARVRLTPLDRGRIGLPFLSGVGLAVWNFFQDLAQFFETLLLSPNAAWGLAVGGIGYSYKSFYGYLTTRQRYHLTLTQSLYFQNLDANAGVLSRLLHEAEEQEALATVLGYHCLWRYAGPEGFTAEDLDTSMELYLDRCVDLAVSVEPGAALARLRKLGLAEGPGGRCRAVPPARAVAVLHAGWDQYFAPPPRGTP